MQHVGLEPPEADWVAILRTLGVDADLAKKAARKVYFEETEFKEYCHHYDVFFIPNNTKYGDVFAIKYGVKYVDV